MALRPTWHIEPVRALQTHALRQQVLRAHQDVAEVGFPGDDDPDAGHFAAFAFAGSGSGSGSASGSGIIGVVSVLRECPATTTAPDPARWWRLRGMATAAPYRNQGVGSALVAAVLAHVAAHHGTVLWCYARLPAVGFYSGAGFAVTGDPWDEPALGPHVAMARAVPPPP
ncbi:MAG: GNAT family N-acetyltransferase [Actinomycetota bacterium]|nr:GNAT family N-acetyltransferase [Actinomycetota bacterium]